MHNKIFMLARTKLNSIKSKIAEALVNVEISHEDFMTIINEERKHWELKESIRMINSERTEKIYWKNSYIEKINLFEKCKK